MRNSAKKLVTAFVDLDLVKRCHESSDAAIGLAVSASRMTTTFWPFLVSTATFVIPRSVSIKFTFTQI